MNYKKRIAYLALSVCIVNLAYAGEQIVLSEPNWVAPSSAVPPEFRLGHSSNNVTIAMHEGRLYMAWRNAATHFASRKTQMLVMSSGDMGVSWKAEKIIALGTDVREPFLMSANGKLIFQFFEAGSNPFKFEPRHMMRTIRQEDGSWSEIEVWGTPGEIPWEVKQRNGTWYMTSYIGDHYSAGASQINVHFSKSTDALNWEPVNPAQPVVYTGGVSEVGFEFTKSGEMFAVTRNEDGDSTGFGSQVATASNWGASAWQFPEKSNPNRYDSPRMFRHNDDLYLVARRDIGGPFMSHDPRFMPFDVMKWWNLVRYSLRPKRTALYRVNQETKSVEWLQDLPSAGDTAFASIAQLDNDHFMIANYSSPVNDGYFSWLHGQISRRGTGVYLLEIGFNQTP
jgi:hypothetical protein